MTNKEEIDLDYELNYLKFIYENGYDEETGERLYSKKTDEDDLIADDNRERTRDMKEALK